MTPMEYVSSPPYLVTYQVNGITSFAELHSALGPAVAAWFTGAKVLTPPEGPARRIIDAAGQVILSHVPSARAGWFTATTETCAAMLAQAPDVGEHVENLEMAAREVRVLVEHGGIRWTP